MSKIIVSDTSCLILLDKLDRLFILKQLFETITITPEIKSEYGKAVPPWIKIASPKNIKYQKIIEAELDKGEASAIALALEADEALLIVDDNKARLYAEKLGIDFIGTLGLLIEAKEAGLIKLVKPVLEEIKKTNFRISKKLEKNVLKLAGE